MVRAFIKKGKVEALEVPFDSHAEVNASCWTPAVPIQAEQRALSQGNADEYQFFLVKLNSVQHRGVCVSLSARTGVHRDQKMALESLELELELELVSWGLPNVGGRE